MHTLARHLPSAWLWLCVLFLLMGANTISSEVAQQRRKRIAGMSPGDKAQLQQNFARFQQMTSEEQHHYRNLHNDIQTDPNIAKLRPTMIHYHEWVKMLPPAQREELRNATDVTTRIQLVQKFQQEAKTYSQKSDLAKAISTLGPNFNWLKQLSRFIGEQITQSIKLSDYDAMISYLENELSQSQREQTKSQRGLKRALAVLSIKLQRPGSADMFKPGAPRNSNWLDERQTHDLIEMITDPTLKKRIYIKTDPQGHDQQTTYLEQRMAVARVLLAGSIHKIQQHIQSQKPSDEVLFNFMENELDAKNRDDIYLMPTEQGHRRLLFLYLTEHADHQSQIDPKKLRTVIGTLAVMGGMRPRGFNNRPQRTRGRRPLDPQSPREFRDENPSRGRPQDRTSN